MAEEQEKFLFKIIIIGEASYLSIFTLI